ncbi:MAG: histidine phosphatase family protein [Candidatus Diapherotrites archaeon]|nr:histidine phosphatase family protein [Candidatus Diapherotrites archaeon]
MGVVLVSVEITYFVHGTTTDNEKGLATGQVQGELSELGKQQSVGLKGMVTEEFDVVFCSDLKRAVDSAKLAFSDDHTIIEDSRLRECDYGDLTGGDARVVYSLDVQSIDVPFPGGESYRDVEKRVRSFLGYLLDRFDGKRVAVVGHRGPQLALDVILGGKSWEQAIKEDWRMKEPKGWRPGWHYTLGK